MAHYLNVQPYREGFLLLLDDGATQLATSAYAAEQLLLSSINSWAGIDKNKADQEMALLTSLIRSC